MTKIPALKTIIFLFLFPGLSFAQSDSLKVSPLKFLSNNQYQLYTTGNDTDMGLVGNVNGYPSPKKAIALAKELGLTEEQKRSIKTILSEMNRKALEMGKFILAEENKLNKVFETKTVNEGSLVFYTNKIGALQGELRNAYLKAHLRTGKILNATQQKKYVQLINKNK